MNQPAETLTLTVAEAADLLRISRSACYESIRRGEIPSIRLGRRIVVPRHVLETMLGQLVGVSAAQTSDMLEDTRSSGFASVSNGQVVYLCIPVELTDWTPPTVKIQG